MSNNASGIKPFVSVIIPTYNRAKILGEALAAYQTQTIPQDQFEIIVVDDGSNDDTDKTVSSLAADQPNIRYFRQEHGGPARARNLGIEKARSALILFTGDDCIPHKYLLQEHLRMHKKGEAIAVLGHIDWHPDLKVTPFMQFISMDTQSNFPKITEIAHNVPYNYFYTSNISLPKKYIKFVGSFDETFKDAVFEDIELGYRMWKCGIRSIYNKHAITYHYHQVSLQDYIPRQIRMGNAAALFYKKHPELLEFLRVPKIVSPEVHYRFYQAALDFYYYIGLQERLDKAGKNLLTLNDRLKNWSNTEQGRLVKNIFSLEEQYRNASRTISSQHREIDKLHSRLGRELSEKGAEIQRRNQEIIKRDQEIARRDQAIAKRDQLVEELNAKNQQKYYRIVELEKLEIRVKSSIFYKIYGMLKKLYAKY